MKEQIIALATIISIIGITPASQSAGPLLSPIPDYLSIFNQETALAEHPLDLTIREKNAPVNQVFTDNILLALRYLKEDIKSPKIDWEKIREPFKVSFVLQPNEVFAFHPNVLLEFASPKATMNSLFFTGEGYKSAYGLGGNGVCHLASLINWVASEASLEVIAKANHNFAPIPGVAGEYGTSIRSQDKNQNLYIRNKFDFPVTFEFEVNNKEVYLRIFQ